MNAVAPGLVICEATGYAPQELHAPYTDWRAMQGRQFPEDVGGAMVFLLSYGAGFVTGELVPVNAGFIFN